MLSPPVDALEDTDAARLVVRQFRDEAKTRQRGAEIPPRAFVLPCIQAI